MKNSIYLILLLLVSSITFRMVHASILQSALIRHIQFIVADFVPPQKVIISDAVLYTNKDEYRFTWKALEDFQEVSQPVYYLFQIGEARYRLEENTFLLSLLEYSDGSYSYQIKACDMKNNCSEWSDQGTLIIDRVAPDIIISWKEKELVPILQLDRTLVGGVTQSSDSEYQISSPQANTYWWNNYLEYSFDSNQGVVTLYFQYQTASDELLEGFDETKLIVVVNDQIIFIENEITGGWKEVFLDIGTLDEPIKTIRFYSGNQGDIQFSSWAYVKNVQFNVIPQNVVEEIQVIATDQEDIWWQKELIENGTVLKIIATDKAGNETMVEMQVIRNALMTPILSDIEAIKKQLGIFW